MRRPAPGSKSYRAPPRLTRARKAVTWRSPDSASSRPAFRRAIPSRGPAEVVQRRSLRDERVGKDRKQVEPLGGLEHRVRDLDRLAAGAGQVACARELATDREGAGIVDEIDEIGRRRLEELERGVRSARRRAGRSRARQSPAPRLVDHPRARCSATARRRSSSARSWCAAAEAAWPASSRSPACSPGSAVTASACSAMAMRLVMRAEAQPPARPPPAGRHAPRAARASASGPGGMFRCAAR